MCKVYEAVKNIFEHIFPSYANRCSNKKVKHRIESRENLDCPSRENSLDLLSKDELQSLLDKASQARTKLEDKAKTNVIGVTISVTLIMGAYTLVQNISGKYGTSIPFWIAFILFVSSVLYMIVAVIHAIHVLTAENIVYYPKPGLEGDEEKKDLDVQVGLNRAQNLIRNNYVFTSYECIRNSLICLFAVMVIAIVPLNSKRIIDSYSQGSYYFSEQALKSIKRGIDSVTVKRFIDLKAKDGYYFAVDEQDGLYIEYSIKDGNATVYVIEEIDRM